MTAVLTRVTTPAWTLKLLKIVLDPAISSINCHYILLPHTVNRDLTMILPIKAPYTCTSLVVAGAKCYRKHRGRSWAHADLSFDKCFLSAQCMIGSIARKLFINVHRVEEHNFSVH